MRHKRTIIGGLVALCGLALLAQHVFERSNFHGDHLLAGIVMLGVAEAVRVSSLQKATRSSRAAAAQSGNDNAQHIVIVTNA